MTKPDPYTRSLHRFPDEYPEIYADDVAYAWWCRLRDEADKAWPSSAVLPRGVKKIALDRLTTARQRLADGTFTDAPLVFLLPNGRYRIRGLDKQREERQARGKAGADARWGRSEGNANALRPQSEGNATGMQSPSRAEQSKAEPVVAMRPEEQREHLDRLRESMTEAGIPTPKPNGKPHRVRAETEPEYIARLEGIRDDESEVGWKREAAKAQLEAMRLQP